jgi:hypothetical protein
MCLHEQTIPLGDSESSSSAGRLSRSRFNHNSVSEVKMCQIQAQYTDTGNKHDGVYIGDTPGKRL